MSDGEPAPAGRLREHLAREAPLGLAVVLVGLLLGGLLVGYEPVGGDPDRLYRPLKSELARALAAGRLPYWSERLGLGVPLVAESQVAALYPLNLVLYRLFDVSAAYRLAMWLHYVLLVAATYGYARSLELKPWGSALGGVTFALCGFQAIHSSNEPFYCLMPYLPLALLAAERFMATGRIVWLAILALCLGVQWTLGHFQIQTWTNGLVILTGLWRVAFDGRPWRRALGVCAGVAWGMALAAVQLGLSWQFAGLVGQTQRTAGELLWYSYPPAHWFELALPWLIRELRLGPEDPYWYGQQTWGYEAALYVGTIPLIFAVMGALGRPLKSTTWMWRILVPVGFLMATMPRWWPQASLHLLALPGPGYFRVPARYTLATSLGLALLAAEGFDHAVAARRFRVSVAVACGLLASAAGCAIAWIMRPDVHLTPFVGFIPAGLLWGGLAWAAALVAIFLWRSQRVGSAAILAAAAAELGILFYLGTTRWGWSIAIPGESRILSELLRVPPEGLVGGEVENLPVRAGSGTAYPYMGFALAQPNRLLMLLQQRLVKGEASGPPDGIAPAARKALLRRLRVSHLVASRQSLRELGREQARGPDDALDQIIYRGPEERAARTWSIVVLDPPIPQARVARRARMVRDRYALIDRLSLSDDLDMAWFLAEDRVPARDDARTARLLSWDGRVAQVAHDGPCDLVIARSFDPGWQARVNEGRAQPVWPVDGGFQAVRLEGSGSDRVALSYQPPQLTLWAAISAVAAGLVIVVLLGTLVSSAFRNRASLIRSPVRI